ncbi:hypothetical protein Tco_1304522 [Tanacetum coccineum]
MRTRSQSRNLHHQQQQAPPPVVEPFNLEEPIENPAPPLAPMDDTRTMAQLLEAPTEGYEDAIVVPEITADNFELKHGLLNLVQNKQFFGHDKEDPHAHIRYFNKITSTMKFPNVPSTSVKLMLFPFSLEGAARIWLEKEPPRSIQTWDDLVSKFINKFFCNISHFQVMAAPTILVFAEENLRDPIDIRVDIIHPEPVAAVAFPAAAAVRTQAQHMEAIRGIHEHLLGVPIQEELTALRFRIDIAEAENASLRARIKTTEAIENITRNRERQVRIKMEQ